VKRLGRAARRRLERAVMRIMDSDVCTLCGRPLAHGDTTFAGAADDGTPAVAGACCAGRLAHTVGVGLYLADAGAYAALAADPAERAGLAGRTLVLSAADAPWRCDDAAWFEAHPDRAHRLRAMAAGEAPTLLRDPADLPPGHAWRVLVRQVAPGRRVRLAVGWDPGLPIPDAEAIVHALFDLVAAGGAGRPVPVEEVVDLALRYAAAAGQAAH
jgi:hypothetical protein